MLGNLTGVLIDEFDFSVGAIFGADVEHTTAEHDNTTFGATAVTAEPGLRSGKISLRGYYSNQAAGAVFKELQDRLGSGGSGVCMAVLTDTSDANCLADCSNNAWQQMLKLSMPAKDLVTFEAATPNEGFETGLRLLNATIVTPATQTSYDFGAAGVAGGIIYVFVQTIGGTATNAIVRVQSAATQAGTYADKAQVTFSAVGGYSAPLNTNVDRWLRVNVAALGGATSIRMVVVACVKGVNY